MKRILIAMVAVTVVAMAGSAIAAGQTRIDISAKVVGTCKFKSASTSIDIAELPFDPDSGAPSGFAASGTTTFWCTRNAAFSISDDDGQNESGVNLHRLGSTNLDPQEFIPYTFSYTPSTGAGLGPGTNINLDITVDVPPAYANNGVDTYTDKVVLTIAP